MQEEDYEVVKNMERFGGSFVKSLAQAFHHADPINCVRLKQAFPDYWVQYKNFHENKTPKES